MNLMTSKAEESNDQPSRRREAERPEATYSSSRGTHSGNGYGGDLSNQTDQTGTASNGGSRVGRSNGAEGREGSPLTTSWQTPGSRGTTIHDLCHKKLLLLRTALRAPAGNCCSGAGQLARVLLLRCSAAPDLLLLLRQRGRPHPPPPSLPLPPRLLLSFSRRYWLVP